MKSTNLVLGMAVIALGFTSCKDEKTEETNKTVDSYVVYVDSLENVALDAKANWSSIEATYEVRSSQAETALSDLKGSEDAKAKVEASKTKYAALQARIQAEMQAPSSNNNEKFIVW
jgi:galactokinase